MYVYFYDHNAKEIDFKKIKKKEYCFRAEITRHAVELIYSPWIETPISTFYISIVQLHSGERPSRQEHHTYTAKTVMINKFIVHFTLWGQNSTTSLKLQIVHREY